MASRGPRNLRSRGTLPPPKKETLYVRFIGGGEFRIQNCHEMALELVCGADFWCNRHCRTSPVVLEGFWGQVWPKIGRKPEKSEYRIANEPLSLLILLKAPGSYLIYDPSLSPGEPIDIGKSVFRFFRFSANLGPKTPLERRGSSCSAGCSKNQPPRPILRPCQLKFKF